MLRQAHYALQYQQALREMFAAMELSPRLSIELELLIGNVENYADAVNVINWIKQV
jgi:hypothetical protein